MSTEAHTGLTQRVQCQQVTCDVLQREAPFPLTRGHQHTHKTEQNTGPRFCTLHASWVQREGHTQTPSQGPALTEKAGRCEGSLLQSQVHGKYTSRDRWPPHLSCSSAGMLMFQPMACLSKPQVNRLHVGWSSLHAEQHTILLWPCDQSHNPGLVRYSGSTRPIKPQPSEQPHHSKQLN